MKTWRRAMRDVLIAGSLASLASTVALIHHASSIFWATVQEQLLHRNARSENTLPGALRDAAITTALAALVDLRLVPDRLTPGFERRLTGQSLAGVYSLFAVGLAIGSSLAARREAK